MVIFLLDWTILIIDDDLAGMYLTEKLRGKQRPLDQHDEVELLLEAYVKQIDGIVQEADQLVTNMRNTEEIVNIILDANRNSLMLLDLKVTSPKVPLKTETDL
jgi:magnesium transporter